MLGGRIMVFCRLLGTIFLLGIVYLTGCSGEEKLPYISIWQNQSEQNQNGETPVPDAFRIAVAGPASAQHSVLYYDGIVGYLEERLGTRVQLILRKSYAEVNDLLRDGTAHLGFVSSYSYILGNWEYGLEIVAVPVLPDRDTFHSYILVHSDSAINRFVDLKNKTFAYTDPHSTMGRLYPLSLISESGYDPDTFFRQHIYTYSTDNAIRAVAGKLVDGAAANSRVFNRMIVNNPEIIEQVRIIYISPPFSPSPVVISPCICPSGKDQIRKIFLSMQDDSAGAAVLAELGLSHYEVPADDALYRGVLTLMDTSVRRETE